MLRWSFEFTAQSDPYIRVNNNRLNHLFKRSLNTTQRQFQQIKNQDDLIHLVPHRLSSL